MSENAKNILILGGGFGGMYAALELQRIFAADPAVRITLVNRENFFSFTPMLHEVAASDLDITHIVNPVRKMLRGVNFFLGNIESIDLDKRSVVVSHGSDNHSHELPYDHLVVAFGSTTNFFGLPGLEERALTIKSLGDAVTLRNRLIENLEEADTECAAAACLREPLMTIVVAGGGFAGVETLAAVNDFVREALPYYPNLSEEHIRTVLVHPGEVILPELSDKLGRYTQRKLEQRGVELRLRTRVASVSDDAVTLNDGTSIRTRLLVWAAGTSPHPLVERLACAKEGGRILVDEFLQVPERPEVWALGDCARVPDARSGGFYPPTAQHALRQGRVAAANIAAALGRGRRKPFSFKTIGQLAAIGRRSGVANIFGINFSGFLAWWLWRTIYLGKLPRTEKKLRVALDWTLDLFFSKDLVQLNTSRS
jgi:NADH dehydrogenase